MRKATDKLSAVSKNTITPILDKARAELPPPPAKTGGGAKPASAPARRDPSAEPSRAKSEAPKSAGSGKPETGGKKPVPKSRLGLTKPASTKKAGEEMDSSPLYQVNKLKNQRFKDESKLKALKWNFATPRAEFVDQLKDQITAANFNKSLFTMMFHADFKQHLKALDMLLEFASSDREALVANLDLILKWMTLRFFETNPSVNIKGLEYLVQVFQELTESEDGYMLHEIEANSFLPYLINKMGDPKDQIRGCCRSILGLVCLLYPASKLFPFLMNGLGTKNAKQRAECLEEIGTHIRKQGISVCGAQPAANLKEIAKQIADRDVSVRNAALNAATEAYFKEGEKLYKLIGHIPEKDMAMLEERIKRLSKNRPVEPEAIGAPSDPPSRKPSSAAKQLAKSGMRPPSAPSAGLGKEGEEGLKMRLQAARGGSAGPARPTSGVFSLDLDKIENHGNERVSDQGPKLVEHNLEDIMCAEPVVLPITKTGMQTRMMSPDHSARSNQEARQAVTAVIAQIFNTNPQASIEALAEIDELLKHEDKSDLIGPCIDHLFSMCSMQYRYVLETRMRDTLTNEKEILRMLQYLTMVLMSVYGHRDQVKKASMQVLHDLMHQIVLILLEPSVANLPEGGQLVRALNVLTVKIVDRSDHNNVASALIKLLHECVGNSGLSEKYCVLVMKCIWKVIRGLPTWLEVMDTAALLADLHSFLVSYPASYGKTMEDDTPIRTIKTVIHTLVKVLGEDILPCLDRIQDPQASEVVPYIRKLVTEGVGKEGKSRDPGSSSKKKAQRFSKSDHEALADIFKKIGKKELSKVGLQELYNFKQQNPGADLEPFLAKSSQYFREYIERGLRGVELEVRAGSNVPPPPAASTTRTTILADSNNSGGQPAHLVYLERLKRLRAAGGLETQGQENLENITTSIPTSGYSSGVGSTYSASSRFSSTTETYQEETPADRPPVDSKSVDEIRKRLAKIKQAAF